MYDALYIYDSYSDGLDGSYTAQMDGVTVASRISMRSLIRRIFIERSSRRSQEQSNTTFLKNSPLAGAIIMPFIVVLRDHGHGCVYE